MENLFGGSDDLAFIFDVDGVIVDSNPVHSACWREYLKGHGLEIPPDFDRNMFGKRNDDILRGLLPEGASEEEIFRHGAAKESLYRQMMKPILQQYLVPGLIDFLRSASSVPKAVASNAEPANVSFVLEEAGIRGFFRFVIDGHQVERPKPFPDIYLKAAELLGKAPSDCVVFEDSYAGVAAARAAGARVVGLLTTHDDLAGADLTISSFLDPGLQPWLNSLRRPN